MINKYQEWLLYGVAIFSFATIIIPILIFYIVARMKEKMKKKQIALQNAIKEYDEDRWEEIYEMELRPFYEEAKSLFTEKRKTMKKDQLRQLKSILYDSLGSFAERYKNYDFEDTPIKEIYVLMKNKYIDKSQWGAIINFLKEA